MAKLTAAEKKGIRLIADVFVLNNLMKNVFAKDEAFKGHMDGLKAHMNKACPKFQLAQDELQKQLKKFVKLGLTNLLKNR